RSGKRPGAGRPPVGRTRGGPSHARPASFRRSHSSGVESGPAQAVLPLVGLAADQVMRDRHLSGGRIPPEWKAARRRPSSRWSDSRRTKSCATGIPRVPASYQFRASICETICWAVRRITFC
ncbi:MAG: hypothetical protein ACQESR_19725, partial [Planctomycetota bacterium]